MSTAEETSLTPRQHEKFFADFCRWELASGGPDPHMEVAGWLAAGQNWHEKAWRLGCYLAAYNVPTGIALWSVWPYERMLAEPEYLEAWIADHWPTLAFRRERRAVRSVPKFARHLVSYAQWINRLPDEPWIGSGDYEAAWKSADQVYGVGRYIKHKLLESLRRFNDIGVELNDIRANGAWSPRTALTLFWPQYRDALLSSGADNDATAEMCASWTREVLAERYGLEVSYYNLQVMLCEYRESVISRRQYPGRSHDSELGYHHKLAQHWDLGEHLKARAALFPAEHLGELGGWDAAREELGDALADHGYVWSDLLFDYSATTDFANPVKRD